MAEATTATRQRSADTATHSRTSPHAPEAEALDATAETLLTNAVDARPGTALADGRLDPHRQIIVLRALQRTHGNSHVQRLLRERMQQTTRNGPIQRAPVCAAPPAAAPPLPPQKDPKFKAVESKVVATAAKEKQHPPAAAKAAEAQKAALGPPNELASQGAATQVEEMAQQEPGAFDKRAFVAAVREAIERITPQTQEDADDFKSSGKAGQVKDQVSGMVASGKEGAQQAIKEKATEPPSATGTPKPVTPMPAETPGPAPGSVGAAAGMPSPKPAKELSLAHGKCETDSMMTGAGVTEQQIKKSNEPEFTGALDAKKQADAHAAAAPQAVKKEEQQALGAAKSAATALAGPAVAGMHGGRAAALTSVGGAKGDTKSQDETKRAEIAAKFEGIYNTTKTEVTAILTGLDAKVNTAFDTGEKAARAAFENHVERRMEAYKDKRYGGLDGPALWLVDKLTSMPPEVNAFYVEGRNLYLARMDGVIENIAGIVERELGRAKARIAQGKKQIAKEVADLPASLKAIGKTAQQAISGKFEQLEQDVNAKQEALVENLAQKYVEARSAVDARIDEMKSANKGLLDYAKDALGGVIETITKLKEMLLGVLAKASNVIDTIIADPIQFLSNLVSAIKMGLNQFVANIGKHLKDGLMGWLLGELAGAGITLPKSLDFKGILDLVLQVMGLTYNAIRARAVKIVGEPTVKKIEQVAEVFKVLITEGPAGLWKWIVSKVDNLVDVVLGGIKDLVITKVITAGITWLISLLNPASAFVKACKMIYDVIMFFVERGSQIMSLVNAIIDSVASIASGALGAAANWVENALAKSLPVAISFLASLLGLGGLSTKIRKIIEEVQKPVGKAVDFVINGVVKGFKKVAGFVGGLFGKGSKDKGATEADQDRLTQGVMAGKEAVEKHSGKTVGKVLLKPLLAAIRLRYRLGILEPVEQGNVWAVRGELRRMAVTTTAKVAQEEFCKVTIYGGKVRLTITYNPEWPYDEFMAKVKALQQAADDGTLMTLPEDPKTGRQQSTRDKRKGEQKALIDKAKAFITRKCAGNQPLHDQLMGLLGQLAADHQVELQLMGEDKPSNMALIERGFNTDIGFHQLRKALHAKLYPGTKIDVVVVKAPASADSPAVTRPTGAARALLDEMLKLATGAGEHSHVRAMFPRDL